MKKLLTPSKLKKKLDKLFSVYIRTKYADSNGYVSCFTCATKKPWKEMQCGHFVSRLHLSTRYDEGNCRPQCKGCNIFGGGRVAAFANRLEAETPGIVKYLYTRAQVLVPNFPYQSLIDKYGQHNEGK